MKDVDTNEMIQRFVLHEGCVLQPYKCPAGCWTIGVGRNIEANPLTEEEKRVCGDYMHGITKNAAYYLLRNDIERVKKECQKNIPFFNKLDKERRWALMDMCFQLGCNGLLKFKRMLGSIGVGNYELASEQCLQSKYAKQTGKRAQRVAKTIRTGRFEV